MSFDYAADGDYKCHTIQSQRAYLTASLHCHLSTHQVIGFLVGEETQKGKVLYISRAIPVSSIKLQEGEDPTTQVEMDPIAQIRAMDFAEKKKQKILGWYHSHPTFMVHPSNIDVKNHFKFQTEFEKNDTPFIGLIISPYNKDDLKQKGGQPSSNCFNVFKNGKMKLVPYAVKFQIVPGNQITENFIDSVQQIEEIWKNMDSKAQIQLDKQCSRNYTYKKKIEQFLLNYLKKNANRIKPMSSPQDSNNLTSKLALRIQDQDDDKKSEKKEQEEEEEKEKNVIQIENSSSDQNQRECIITQQSIATLENRENLCAQIMKVFQKKEEED